ncbi:hypothetical protein V8C86DRAFT_2458846 [Haematococcus lacustris]
MSCLRGHLHPSLPPGPHLPQAAVRHAAALHRPLAGLADGGLAALHWPQVERGQQPSRLWSRRASRGQQGVVKVLHGGVVPGPGPAARHPAGGQGGWRWGVLGAGTQATGVGLSSPHLCRCWGANAGRKIACAGPGACARGGGSAGGRGGALAGWLAGSFAVAPGWDGGGRVGEGREEEGVSGRDAPGLDGCRGGGGRGQTGASQAREVVTRRPLRAQLDLADPGPWGQGAPLAQAGPWQPSPTPPLTRPCHRCLDAAWCCPALQDCRATQRV